MKALIICALPLELLVESEIIDRHSKVFTGIGKVSAISSLGAVFDPEKVFDPINLYDIVINIGTCGGTEKGKSFLINKHIDGDLELFPSIGFPIVSRLINPHAERFMLDMINYKIVDGVCPCITSDIFKTDINDPAYVYDMESFALASFFSKKAFQNIPFISIKYVSDAGDLDTWEKGLEADSKAITAILEKALLFFHLF